MFRPYIWSDDISEKCCKGKNTHPFAYKVIYFTGICHDNLRATETNLSLGLNEISPLNKEVESYILKKKDILGNLICFHGDS